MNINKYITQDNAIIEYKQIMHNILIILDCNLIYTETIADLKSKELFLSYA